MVYEDFTKSHRTSKEKTTHSRVDAQASLSSFSHACATGGQTLNFRAVVSVALVVSMYFLAVNVPSQVNALDATCTSSLPPASTGLVQVYFDSVSLWQFYPQTCSFNIVARALSPGSSITKLVWHFGDGTHPPSVPYCCQNPVSEIRYHGYAQPGVYTVSVDVFDNMGNTGSTQVAVTWSS